MTQRRRHVPEPSAERSETSSLRRWQRRALAAAALPALLAMAGCAAVINGDPSGSLAITPNTAVIDTNCAGCNATSASGAAVEQFVANLGGSGARVGWSVSGGDASAGPGTIRADGQYTPPSYLTADSVQVTVTATLAGSPSTQASTTITLKPGFLQPLTPENVALGAGGTATITSYIAEAGGSSRVSFAVASTPTGSGAGEGSLSNTSCTRGNNAFTSCTVTYTAPATVTSNRSDYVIASMAKPGASESTAILLNTQGISSNPVGHETQLATPVMLGSSGGNNNDYDTKNNLISDCCGGTLGSLIQNSNGRQYLLSCNHVLARSDQASVGEMIIQPGLIDNNCTPNGEGAGTTPVGILTAWLPLSLSTTNADAAIAQVNAESVNPSGAILELGAPQAGGTLAAAPPGISSTGGKGETGSLNLTVAKSGRTTGLTCGNISALDLTVNVEYFKDCGETIPYLTKTYTNQIAIEGNEFSDAGDSGSLVVDASNAEPVGLFFAGGLSISGVSEGVANPAPMVLAELSQQEGANFTFVGTADHPVSCLNYSSATVVAAQSGNLSAGQQQRARQAVGQARMLINPALGILGAAEGQSSDHAGEAAVIVYVDQSKNAAVPQLIDGVRTVVIPTTAHAVAAGTAPQSVAATGAPEPLASAVLKQAIAAKEQVTQSLMEQNPAFFGVGVGQSLDNPREAALVIYVDRRQVPASLPAVINGLRTRFILMDRLHVTRSYLQGPVRSMGHCLAHPGAGDAQPWGAAVLRRQLGLRP